MKNPFRSTQLLVLVLMLLLSAGCQTKATPHPTPTPTASVFAPSGTAESGPITALGTIKPARTAQLSFSTSGQVRAVVTRVGMEVKAGDVLVELDATGLELAVQEAEHGLALRQALLAQVMAGASEQEVAIAEAECRRALAQHEQLLSGTPAEEIAAAQAEYDAALARYEQVKSGASEEELIVAGANLDKAEAALQRAQAAYDAVAWQPAVGSSPQAAALQAATAEYQIAKAQHELIVNLPTEADLQGAKATLARAEAQLKLAQTGPTEQELAVSAGSVAIAEARLALLQAGPRPEEVAAAEAPVGQARTVLERARLSLSRSRLLAPFDGTVSAVYAGPGEWAGPGMPVVELVDTTRWRVETRNVSELTIGRVLEGQEVVVRVIALGDREARGRVVAVSPVAVVQQGDTTYTLMIELEPTDLGLRPGMNARVEILTE